MHEAVHRKSIQDQITQSKLKPNTPGDHQANGGRLVFRKDWTGREKLAGTTKSAIVVAKTLSFDAGVAVFRDDNQFQSRQFNNQKVLRYLKPGISISRIRIRLAGYRKKTTPSDSLHPHFTALMTSLSLTKYKGHGKPWSRCVSHLFSGTRGRLACTVNIQ